MPDPLRLRVQKSLAEWLEGINPENGYDDVDLREKVFRGRTWFGPKDPLPMLSILEPPLTPDQLPQPTESTVSSGDYDLLIQGFVKDDPLNPTDPGHELMAMVKQRLSVAKLLPETNRGLKGVKTPTLGLKEITSLQIGAGVVRPPDQDISEKAYFWLNITLGLAEDFLKPYEED